MTSLSDDHVRQLTAADLGRAPVDEPEPGQTTREGLTSLIADEDPILQQTLDLLESFGGIIFSGAPGTSKSWYAGEIALKLTKGRKELVRFVLTTLCGMGWSSHGGWAETQSPRGGYRGAGGAHEG